MPSSTQPLVFIGGYAAPTASGIHAFSFDSAPGALTLRGSFTGIVNPSFLVVHPNGRWLYAVSETSQSTDGVSGGVWAFRFEREPLTIQPINHQPSGGDWPCHLQLDSTGQWLLTTNYGTGNVAAFPIQPDGSLGSMSDLAQHHGTGLNAKRQEGPHAHSANLTPDGRYFIVADLGIDALVVYQLDATGKLREHGRTPTRPGAGPRHMTFHPNGNLLYVANELDNTVAVYDYAGADGALRELQVLDTLPPGAPENTVADIHISASGGRLYVSNRGHNSLAVYEVGSDGLLTRLAVPECGGNWPRNFALSPDDRFAVVANQYSGDLCVLPVLDSAPGLGATLARVAVPQASCVQFVKALA